MNEETKKDEGVFGNIMIFFGFILGLIIWMIWNEWIPSSWFFKWDWWDWMQSTRTNAITNTFWYMVGAIPAAGVAVLFGLIGVSIDKFLQKD